MRQLGPTDARAAAALHARCFAKPWGASAFESWFSRSDILAIGGPGLDNGVLDGLIVAQVAGDTADIVTVAVAPDRRGQGIGHALIGALGDAAAEQGGIAQLFLEVAADNTAALALYRGADFVQVGVRRGYYPAAHEDGPRVDALTFVRPIGRSVEAR